MFSPILERNSSQKYRSLRDPELLLVCEHFYNEYNYVVIMYNSLPQKNNLEGP